MLSHLPTSVLPFHIKQKPMQHAIESELLSFLSTRSKNNKKVSSLHLQQQNTMNNSNSNSSSSSSCTNNLIITLTETEDWIVLDKIHQLLCAGQTLTQRGFYYSFPQLYKLGGFDSCGCENAYSRCISHLNRIVDKIQSANSKFDFINHFKTFIEYPEMYTLKVNAINVNEDATNLFQGLYKNKTIDYEALLDLLKDAKYISPEDIKQAKNIPQRINLVLEKNIPKDPLEKKKRNVFPDFAFSKTKKLAFIIAFTGDSDNQILLGTIDKHAFFEVKDKNALKEFCMEYLELP